MKKRILSLITALALILSLTVPSAFAEDYTITSVSYSSLGGVCMFSWTDIGYSGGYAVMVYTSDGTYVDYTMVYTNAILARDFGLTAGSYYYTVCVASTDVNVISAYTATSEVFSYDPEQDSQEYIVYNATYDSNTDVLRCFYSGDFYGFRIEVYSSSGELVNTVYKTSDYSGFTNELKVAGNDIVPFSSGEFYCKIYAVDEKGDNVSSSLYWTYCLTNTYTYSGSTAVVFDANGGYLNGDSKVTSLFSRVDNYGKVTFPTNQFKMGQMLEGWYTAAEGGDLVTASTTFTSDTTLYAHWVTCDHLGSTGRSTCDLMATCSVCGNRIPYSHTMTHIDYVAPTCSEDGRLECYYCTSCGRYYSSDYGYPNEVLDDITDPATGNHTFDEDNKCTTCGAIGASDATPSTSTSGSAVISTLSITATDNSTNSALSAAVNGSSVTSSTISISRSDSVKLEGTLSVSQVSTSNITNSGTITLSDTSGSLTLGNTTSGTAISAGTTLTGSYTTTSGDITPMKGEVLFYGDISYSDEDVIEKSTFSISLTPTSSLDLSTLSLLHYDTTKAAWEQLAISSATQDNSGAVTLTFQTTSLSPVMVLTTGANYGTVQVGNVELSDGEYTTDGTTKSTTNIPTSGYAYYSGGVLYLNNFTLTVTGYSGITFDGDLPIVVTGTNTITVTNSEYGIYASGDLVISGSGTLDVVADYDYKNELVVAVLSEGNITITGTTVTAKATNNAEYGYAYAITPLYDLTIENSTVTATATADGDEGDANALYSVYGDISITESTVKATASANGTTEYTSAEAIYADNDITISSRSSVTAAATSVYNSSAIYADGSLTISDSTKVEATATATGSYGWAVAIETGSGDINITSTPVNVTATASGDNGDALGLYAGAELNISQSTVTATANTTSGYSFATSAYNYLTISESTITAKATGAKAYAIEAYNDIIINDASTVNATATGSDARAIYAYSDIAITASDVTADGGILTLYGTITLTPDTNKTLEVTLGTGATPTSYTAATEIEGDVWSSYSYIKIAQADASSGGTEPSTHTHSYDEGSVTNEATCDEPGLITYTCTVCGETYTEEIPATGHTTEIQNAKDATCGEDGYTGDEVCTVCHETITAGTVIAATGNHTYDAGVVRKEVTCTEDGYITYTCLVCGDSYTEEIQATGHSYEADVTAPTCTEQGYTTYTCSVCGNNYVDDYTAALGHTTEIQNAKDATCGEDGYTGDEVCTVCHETITAGTVISATGNHTYDAGVVTKEATCTENGEMTYTCTACGQTYTEEIPATGHSYTDSYVWDDGFTSCTVTLICENCSSVVQYISATDDEVTITEVDGLFTVTLIHDGKTYSTSVQTYTVTWVDGDGNEVQVDSRLLEGETVEYTGSTPTKASDDEYSYTFAGWDKTVEAVSENTTYTATFTTSAHNYKATFNWASNYKSASVTFTCSDCGHTVEIDSSEVTIKSTNNLGVVTRVATVTFNGETYTDSVTTGTSLLVISADYTAVNLAIARANDLDASNYSNFDTVTAAIDAVQWGLNVLNQSTVTGYADAINEAIDSLVLADLVEETVEINEPIEGTDTVTEPDDEPEEVEVNDPEPEANPTTGIMISLMAIALAAAAAGVSKRR